MSWSGRPGSNRGPPAPKAGALPGCATPRRKMPTGSEAPAVDRRCQRSALPSRFPRAVDYPTDGIIPPSSGCSVPPCGARQVASMGTDHDQVGSELQTRLRVLVTRWGFPVAGWVLFILSYGGIHASLGPQTALAALVPVVATAWRGASRGRWPGSPPCHSPRCSILPRGRRCGHHGAPSPHS